MDSAEKEEDFLPVEELLTCLEKEKELGARMLNDDNTEDNDNEDDDDSDEDDDDYEPISSSRRHSRNNTFGFIGSMIKLGIMVGVGGLFIRPVLNSMKQVTEYGEANAALETMLGFIPVIVSVTVLWQFFKVIFRDFKA